jgi:hypothetical protein
MALVDSSVLIAINASAVCNSDLLVWLSGQVDIVIVYGTSPMSENLSLFADLRKPVLSIEGVAGTPEGGLWWRIGSSLYWRWLFDQGVRVRALLLSLPSYGDYKISAQGNQISGFLASGHGSEIEVNGSGRIIGNATF